LVAVATTATTPWILVTAIDVAGVQVCAHGVQSGKQLGPECRCILDLKGPILILEDAMGWRPAFLLFHERAVGCKLEDMGRVRLLGRRARLDLHRDHAPPAVNEVIWLAGQEMLLREQRAFTAVPGTGIYIGHAPLGQARIPAN
jgi:hypothetical protein